MFDRMLQCPLRPLAMERLWKSNAQVAPNCPRCASTNTKFCYYNNYSFSQPRYFCKACRRYWTKGGSLRNVPVGGGCRRSRRPKPARSSYPINPPSPGRSGSDPVNESDGSSDIDLAAVFAKYLNQNSGSEETASLDLPASSGFDEGRVHEGVSRVEDDANGFTGHDPNGFGLQAIMPDELPGEVTLTDGEIMPDFGWQLQEFGSFLGDDVLKISTNVMSDNWSSLDMDMDMDILGYDIFSRPSNLI